MIQWHQLLLQSNVCCNAGRASKATIAPATKGMLKVVVLLQLRTTPVLVQNWVGQRPFCVHRFPLHTKRTCRAWSKGVVACCPKATKTGQQRRISNYLLPFSEILLEESFLMQKSSARCSRCLFKVRLSLSMSWRSLFLSRLPYFSVKSTD